MPARNTGPGRTPSRAARRWHSRLTRRRGDVWSDERWDAALDNLIAEIIRTGDDDPDSDPHDG